MTVRPRLAAFTLAVVATSAVLAAGGGDAGSAPASAPVAAVAAAPASEPHARDRSHGDAFAQCEAAVGNSIREIRGRAVQDLQFTNDARTLGGDGEHVDVKGAGRYRRGSGAPIAFRYSCAFDETTGATSGVLFHEADNSPAPALPVWQADLSRISPEACDSAAATALQSTHPRASGIVFDGDKRKLEPGSEGRTALAGTGRMVRAPGMQPSTFRYRCEFDATGRLVAAHANE